MNRGAIAAAEQYDARTVKSWRHRHLGHACLLTATVMLACGCEPSQPESAAGRRESPPQPPVSAWKTLDASAQVAVPVDEQSEAMQRAISRARQTSESAMLRWREASDEQRTDWAVKWAAPTADDGVEYLWVTPLHWSPFRIEGRLANPPQRELTRDAELGDIVSFPADQLVDWVHFTEGSVEGPREGGFTVDVLEQRFGPPKAESGAAQRSDASE